MLSSRYTHKPYNPHSPQLFAAERAQLENVLPFDIQIEHFGSSAVPGLGGKGVIDIYLLSTPKNIKKIAQLLENRAGYAFRPLGGDERRLFFRKYIEDQLYHLHLSDFDNPNFLECRTMRDYLRAHATEALQYDQVKMHASSLALQKTTHEEQKKIYQASKKTYIDELTKKALIWWKKQGADGGI